VLAANGCQLQTRNRKLRLFGRRLVDDEERKMMPMPIRLFLAILNVSDFLDLTTSSTATSR